MLAAVKNKPCGWPLFEQPFLTAPARGGATVCIGRGGGMAPAKQRNAAYSLTPLPTRFLKEAPKNPNASWRWGKATVKERYDELVFKNGSVYTKNYEKEGVIPRSLLIDERFGRTRTGKTELYEMFGKEVFSNPKPSKLITYLVNLIPSKNCIFLDFFAGSGTTGHAVLQLNEKDGGNRRFILCTNNENNICEDVTYEGVAPLNVENERQALLALSR